MTVTIRHYLALIAIAASVTVLLTPLVRALAIRLGVVDKPGGRKVHHGIIPRLGGIAVFAGFAVALTVQVVGERYFGWSGELATAGAQLWWVLAALALVFAVGVADDFMGMKAGPKMLGMLIAAGIAVWGGPRIDFVGNPFGDGLLQLGVLAIPVTMIYIVGFANVVNLIDGLDGLAAGVTAISGTTFLVISAQGAKLEAALLAAALVGACLGFLRYNFHPATVFMGDSGSLFLGFALAVISLFGILKSVAAIALAVPLLIIGVPVFDTASAIIRRWRHNKPIHIADKGHIHHRLLMRGFDQKQTVIIIYLWSAGLSAGGYALLNSPPAFRYIAFLVLAVLSGFMAYWIGLFEAAHHHGEGDD